MVMRQNCEITSLGTCLKIVAHSNNLKHFGLSNLRAEELLELNEGAVSDFEDFGHSNYARPMNIEDRDANQIPRNYNLRQSIR